MKYILLLALMGIVSAEVYVPLGECQTFELMNGTNESICGRIPDLLEVGLNASDANNSSYLNTTRNIHITCTGSPIIENITIVENVTVLNVTNVTNVTNITYTSCPPVSLTMYANSTQTINNATINCVQNSSAVVYQPVNTCNLSLNFTPSAAKQYFYNASSNADIVFNEIPYNYCYDNVNQYISGNTVYRSDRCNTTLISQPVFINQSASCPAPVACATCPEIPYCATEDFRLMAVEANNTVASLAAKLNTTQAALDGRDSLESIVDKKVADRTSPIVATMAADQEMNSNMLAVVVFGGVGLLAAWKFVAVKGVVNASYPANTQDSVSAKLDRLEKYERGE